METLAEQPLQYKNLESRPSYDDVVTQFSETLDGAMRTSFELRFDGRELYGHDGRAMGEVLDKALLDAQHVAKIKPNLLFEHRRRLLEKEEYLDLIKMAHNQLPNTMVVVSDFPAELMDARQDVGGYNVRRKQTMLRILTRQPNGNISLVSQSLDGSDRRALEAIYEELGFRARPDGLLGQRLHKNLTGEEQSVLVDRLTGVYDRTLAAQYGGQWYAGRRPLDYRNTYDFVRSQQDLINLCLDMDQQGLLNTHAMYDLAAAMQKRFAAGETFKTGFISSVAMLDPSVLHWEIASAGNEARSAGQSFSACGATLRAEGLDSSTEGRMKDAGFGNKTDEKTNYKFDRKMHCVVCQPKAKKTDVPKMCGPCGICRSCDRKLGGAGV